MKTLPKRALGLDAVDLGVAAVIVEARAREDQGTKLHQIAERLQAASWQLAPPTTDEGEDR